MSRSAAQPANPAPATHSTNRDPDARGISPRPYSFFRPFPNLPEKWQTPQAQAKLLNEYLTHDGHFATFAAQRDLSVDQLYDWLHSEEIVDQRKRLSDLAQERADLLARLARPAAIEALLNLLTQNSLSNNHRRLTATALLRAAAAADKREERQARAARTPSVSERAAPDLPTSNLPAPRPAPESSASTSDANTSPARPASRGGTSAALTQTPARAPSSPRILARIGPAGSLLPNHARQRPQLRKRPRTHTQKRSQEPRH